MKSRVAAMGIMFALAHGAVVHASRPMYFERLGPDDDLAQEAANAIAQDKAGFLWIGTEDGLDRYDGYILDHSRHERKNPRSLPNSYIGGLATDGAGVLWIATDGGGIVRRDAQRGEFIPLELSAHDAADLARVRVLRFDRAGRLWIGSRDHGVALYDPQARHLTRFRHDSAKADTLADDSIYSLIEDRRGDIWIGTSRGLDRLDSRTRKVKHEGSGFRVRALLEDRGGLIWAGTEAGLLRIDPDTGARSQFKAEAGRAGALPIGDINALLQDRDGHLWIGTDGGLALYDSQRHAFEVYRHDPTDPASLPDNQIMSLFEDRSGLLWVGTKFGGLAKWSPRSWSFGHRRTVRDGGAASSNVMAFTEDAAGRMWIAVLGEGVTVLDGQGRVLNSLRHDPLRPGSLSDDRVMTLLTAHDGTLWAGTMGGGLNRIAPGSQRATVYMPNASNPQSLSAPGVMSLLEDSAHRLWVGTYGGGLCRFDAARNQFIRYSADPADVTKLASDRVTALAEDRSGKIWAGTDGGGLNLLDPASGRFFRLRHDPNDMESLSADTVYSILVDRAGTVWVGTRGGGLDRVVGSARAPQSIHFANIEESSGLPNNSVYGIRADPSGMLWVSTNRGLARVDPRSGAVRAFHRNQGTQDEEFNFGAHYANREGMLFFGGGNGYNAFDPAHLELNRVPPPVVLTAVRQAGTIMRDIVPGAPQAPLKLASRSSALTFEFAALDFAAPHANRYQYRLDGVSLGWTDLGTQHSISHTNLDGGHYTLHVRAANADGVWSSQNLDIALDVSPPWWKSIWAVMAYALLVLMFIGLAWRAHRRSLEQEALYRRDLEEEVQKRTRELAERARELERLNRKLEAACLTHGAP